MRLLTAYNTDIGITKQVNQDALLIKVATIGDKRVALFGICDGMGGLSMGEIASTHVINRFSKWFEDTFAKNDSEPEWEEIRQQWGEIVADANRELAAYGVKNGTNLGTTCTMMLIYDETYYIVHIGDSRIYEILDQIHQLTEDQTVLAREIARGHVLPQDAAKDARGSVLLQCVGASNVIEPQYLTGTVHKDAVYMLCSDGFRHTISDEEFLEGFHPHHMTDERIMEQQCVYFTDLNKSRMERDNISVVLVKVE